MAILTQSSSNMNPFSDVIGDDLAPPGTYVATVIDIKDQFGLTRTKFQSDELEQVDLTCFLFGFRDARDVPHRVASRQMRISGNEKSALFGFLKNLLGRAPKIGWDYCTLKGSKCLLTVEHVQRRDGNGVFAGIAALSPVPVGYGTQPMVPAVQMPAPLQQQSAALPPPPVWTAPAPVPPNSQTADQASEAFPF